MKVSHSLASRWWIDYLAMLRTEKPLLQAADRLGSELGPFPWTMPRCAVQEAKAHRVGDLGGAQRPDTEAVTHTAAFGAVVGNLSQQLLICESQQS